MFDVIMPKMGESITEGTVLEWKKSIGDSVAKDETLLEISTDKVDSEIPSPASGTILEIIAQVNDTIPVGDVIARIGSANEKLDIPSKEPSHRSESTPKPEIKQIEPSVPTPVKTSVAISSQKRFYSPLVKSIATKEGISKEELDSLPGSGKNRRVNKQDILSYLNNKTETIVSEKVEPGLLAKTQVIKPMSDTVETMSRMRKKIAEHMVQSLRISPHVYTTVEADVTNLVNIRSNHNENFKNRSGVSLTYTPMILDACILTIQEFPLMNASLNGDEIMHHRNINMGVAVALHDDNLIVPVIHSSEEKNFLGLARATADLANRARNNKLKPDEIFGSTFTVTNPGVFGCLFGMGIINQPNVGILSVGSFQKRPVVKETEYGDSIVVRHMVYLTLSYDHRIIDGSYGTRFMARIVKHLESYSSKRLGG